MSKPIARSRVSTKKSGRTRKAIPTFTLGVVGSDVGVSVAFDSPHAKASFNLTPKQVDSFFASVPAALAQHMAAPLGAFSTGVAAGATGDPMTRTRAVLASLDEKQLLALDYSSLMTHLRPDQLAELAAAYSGLIDATYPSAASPSEPPSEPSKPSGVRAGKPRKSR